MREQKKRIASLTDFSVAAYGKRIGCIGDKSRFSFAWIPYIDVKADFPCGNPVSKRAKADIASLNRVCLNAREEKKKNSPEEKSKE